DYLRQCDRNPNQIKQHDRKVYGALALYAIILALAALTLWKMPEKLMEGPPREKFAEAVIRQKMHDEPKNYVWHQLLADLKFNHRHYPEAVVEYKKAIELSPEQAEVLNNLAWLLLTVPDKTIFNPKEALSLARQAVILEPNAHILDTLALASWYNGFTEQALLAEQRALAQDPINRDYYTSQMKKFAETTPER
ncbi:MAG: tetratricopeptide repeat protein, partial [Desulfobulbaceae bacterium]|nr:tetratricopeptide repeat protein [Desulfobulbaceae bacterium]